MEAWHINSAHAPLNRDDGGLLPDTYLHLINRWCHDPKSSPKSSLDEDTRPECRNVESWIIASLGYVHKFLQTRVTLYYAWPGCRELVSYRDWSVFTIVCWWANECNVLLTTLIWECLEYLTTADINYGNLMRSWIALWADACSNDVDAEQDSICKT